MTLCTIFWTFLLAPFYTVAMKTKMICLWVGAMVAGAFLGCGSNSDNRSYELTVNGCETGKHEFSSKGDYCSALKDDSLNHGCATSLRQQMYQSECS